MFVCRVLLISLSPLRLNYQRVSAIPHHEWHLFFCFSLWAAHMFYEVVLGACKRAAESLRVQSPQPSCNMCQHNVRAATSPQPQMIPAPKPHSQSSEGLSIARPRGPHQPSPAAAPPLSQPGQQAASSEPSALRSASLMRVRALAVDTWGVQ